MTYIISQPEIIRLYNNPVYKKSFWLRFIIWSTNQEEINHVGWVGISILLMAGLFFPATMLAVLMNGASFNLIIAAMAPLVAVIVTNLAAMPTRYTIPVLFFAILIEIGVIVASFLI